jgi:hypothetical protein
MQFHALRDSTIESPNCRGCGIQSIEIDSDHIPRNLKFLNLTVNCIDADGWISVATWGGMLLQHIFGSVTLRLSTKENTR